MLTKTLSHNKMFLVILGVFCVALFVPRSLSFILLIPGLALYVHQVFLSAGKRSLHPAFMGGVLVVVALSFASCLFAVDTSLALERALKISPLLILGSIGIHGYFHNPNIHVIYIFKALGVALFLALYFIVIDLFFDQSLYRFLFPDYENLRPHVHNRSVVVILLLGIPCLYFLLKNRDVFVPKKILWGILILSGVGLLALLKMTWSQSVQLGVVLALLVFFVFPVRFKLAWYVLNVFLVLCIFLSPLIVNLLYEGLASHPSLNENLFLKLGSAGQRLEIWYSLSNLVAEKPLFGYGIDGTRSLILQSPGLFWTNPTVLHPHNFALQLWLEFGVMGAIIGSGILSYICVLISRIDGPFAQRAVLAGFVAWLVVAATGYSLWQSWWLGLTISLIGVWYLALKTPAQDPETRP